MILDHNWTFFSKIRLVLNTAVTPIQYVVNWPVEFVQNLDDNLTSHSSLLEENNSLKMQVLLLHAQIQTLTAIEQENTELRQLLSSAPKTTNRVIAAQVLAVDSDPYVEQIVLNRGIKDNLYVGQPVLDDQGIMGQVIDVGQLTSRVMLLSDPRSGIAVNVVRNGLRAIAVGSGNSEQLKLANIPVTSDVKVDDVLVSSGLDLRYPTGYPVGIVTSVDHDKGAPYLTITVKPNAHLNRSRLVLLMWIPHSDTSVAVKHQLDAMTTDSQQAQLNEGDNAS